MSLINGILKRRNNVVIDNVVALRHEILTLCHSSPIGGHSGIIPILHRLQEMFYWNSMGRMWGILWKLMVPVKGLNMKEWLALVYCNLYPFLIQISLTCSWILLVGYLKLLLRTLFLQWFTTYAHFIGLSHLFIAAQVTQHFFDQDSGCVPTSIVSYRDPILLSGFSKDFMRLRGVT